MIKNGIGKELKKAEKSQAWLADFTGISTGMVSQLASGRSVPTPKELSLICAAFLCRPEELYAPEAIAMIMEKEKPDPAAGKPHRGKNILLTDPIADVVDKYGSKYALSRNEAARDLIIIGLLATKSGRFTFPEEVISVETDIDFDASRAAGH